MSARRGAPEGGEGRASGSPGGIDSRAWTGPEPQVPEPADRAAALAAFARAGGPAATRPQRMAGLVVFAGLVPFALLALFGASGLDPWPLSPRAWDALRANPLADALRAVLEASGLAALAPHLGAYAALLALLASLAGIALAWRGRTALARGFRAAEAGSISGSVFVTRLADPLPPVLGLAFIARAFAAGEANLLTAFLLVPVVVLLARAVTALAERRVAGLGRRSAEPSTWDLVTLAAALAAMLALLAYAVMT